MKTKKSSKGKENADQPFTSSRVTCECGMTVHVGTGGSGNLREHQKSNRHLEIMLGKENDKQNRSIKSFFLTSKQRPPPVPTPLPLMPSTMNKTSSSDLRSSSSKLLQCLKHAIIQLPSTIPAGTPEDEMAQFYAPPSLDATLDDQWELFDPILNRFLGYGRPLSEIQGVIRSGPYGLAGFYNWVDCCITKGKVAEGLLEPKIDRLIDVLRDLGNEPETQATGSSTLTRAIEILDVESLSSSASDNQVTGSSTMPIEILDIQPSRSISFGTQGTGTSTSTPIEIIDIDMLDTETLAVSHKSSERQLQSQNDDQILCQGLKVLAPPGSSVFNAYPFNVHAEMNLPWSLNFRRGSLFLVSETCIKKTYMDPCPSCCSLRRNRILAGILQRMDCGAHEATPWKWLSHAQLMEVAHRQNRQLNSLKLSSLNIGRSLASRTTGLDEHKRFLLNLAKGDVPNIQRLVKVALRNGLGISGIIERMTQAGQSLYSPKSYEERDYHIALLIWRFGGARAAAIAQKALHLPCKETLRQRRQINPLLVSPRYPTIEEITQNLAAYQMLPLQTAGLVLMVDEIATESRLRYDAANNQILGVCRKHSRGYTFTFNDIDDADVLLSGLRDGQIHFASEATVIAIGSLSHQPRLRPAFPITISGTCKRESAEEHVRVLKAAIAACCKTFKHAIYCIASDGESKRGRALNFLTTQTELSDSSPLFKYLGELSLFDLTVGPDELTVDKDYKHIFKRFRNALLRPKGVVIEGTYILPSVLRQHLIDKGVEKHQVDMLLNPNDRQDVPLSLSLLVAVWNIPRSSGPSNTPNYERTRERMVLLGELLSAYVKPYLTPSMSLAEQLTSLSKAAHLALALFASGGNNFIPTQLYTDLQLAIKNVYFCVAKTKRDFPRQDFHLTLMGTDRLESQFGNLRTIVGSDTNVDLLQIGSRLAHAAECTTILLEHPEWDRGPRRLHVPSLGTDSSPLLNGNIDRVNPELWTADLAVSNVTLMTTWRKGRIQAEQSLQANSCQVPFKQIQSTPHATVLAPQGLPLLKRPMNFDDMDDDLDKNMESIQAVTALTDEEIEPDMEDIINSETSTTTHEHTVMIQGKPVHKASVLRLYSHPLTSNGPQSTDRLRRVRGYKRFETNVDPSVEIGTEQTDGHCLMVNDPALTLVKVQDQVFLAVIQVAGFKLHGIEKTSVPLENLKDDIRVRFQILKLTISEETTPESSDWFCDGRTINFGMEYGILEVSGGIVQAFNPTISSQEDGSTRFHFATTELTAMTAILHQQLIERPECHVPHVKLHDSYPYRYEGKACFNCQQDDGETLGSDDSVCPRCGPKVYAGNGATRITHNSAHILFDVGLKQTMEQPCGFCLRNSPACLIFLTGGKDVQVDYKKSNCPRITKFAYKPAAKYTPKSPCTNVPLHCPVCPIKAPAIWRYNLKSHLQQSHPDTDIDLYEDLWRLSPEETHEMESIWERTRNARMTTRKRHKAQNYDQAMVVSQGHTSRLALRTTDLSTLQSDPSKERPRPRLRKSKKQEKSNHDDKSDAEAESSSISGSDSDSDYERKDLDSNNIDESNHKTNEEFEQNFEPAFMIVEKTRRGRLRRQRPTFFEEICDCGTGDRLDLSTDEWTKNPELIECQGQGCETGAFHRKCQGLTQVPHAWRCDSYPSVPDEDFNKPLGIGLDKDAVKYRIVTHIPNPLSSILPFPPLYYAKDEQIGYYISSADLLYRLLCFFPELYVGPDDGYKSVWSIEIHHKRTGHTLIFSETKGSCYWDNSRGITSPGDRVKLLNALIGMTDTDNDPGPTFFHPAATATRPANEPQFPAVPIERIRERVEERNGDPFGVWLPLKASVTDLSPLSPFRSLLPSLKYDVKSRKIDTVNGTTLLTEVISSALLYYRLRGKYYLDGHGNAAVQDDGSDVFNTTSVWQIKLVFDPLNNHRARLRSGLDDNAANPYPEHYLLFMDDHGLFDIRASENATHVMDHIVAMVDELFSDSCTHPYDGLVSGCVA